MENLCGYVGPKRRINVCFLSSDEYYKIVDGNSCAPPPVVQLAEYPYDANDAAADEIQRRQQSISKATPLELEAIESRVRCKWEETLSNAPDKFRENMEKEGFQKYRSISFFKIFDEVALEHGSSAASAGGRKKFAADESSLVLGSADNRDSKFKIEDAMDCMLASTAWPSLNDEKVEL